MMVCCLPALLRAWCWELPSQAQVSKPDFCSKLGSFRHLGVSFPLANEPVNNSPSCSWKQLALRSSLEPQGPPPDQRGKGSLKETGRAEEQTAGAVASPGKEDPLQWGQGHQKLVTGSTSFSNAGSSHSIWLS